MCMGQMRMPRRFRTVYIPSDMGEYRSWVWRIGGDKITTATTYVLMPMVDGEDCIVYFAGRFAYKVPYSTVFRDDVAEQRMEPVYRSGKYVSAAKEEYR